MILLREPEHQGVRNEGFQLSAGSENVIHIFVQVVIRDIEYLRTLAAHILNIEIHDYRSPVFRIGKLNQAET